MQSVPDTTPSEGEAGVFFGPHPTRYGGDPLFIAEEAVNQDYRDLSRPNGVICKDCCPTRAGWRPYGRASVPSRTAQRDDRGTLPSLTETSLRPDKHLTHQLTSDRINGQLGVHEGTCSRFSRPTPRRLAIGTSIPNSMSRFSKGALKEYLSSSDEQFELGGSR